MSHYSKSSDLVNKSQVLFLVCGLIVTILASAIKSVYQIYFIDLPDIYNLSRSQVSLLGALFGLFVGIFSPITGWLCDKYGASLTIISGIVVAIIGFYGISVVDTLPLLIVCFSILLSYALTAMTFIPFGILIDSVFNENTKNASYTLLANGTAIGFIVLSPLWVYLNGFVGWQSINSILSVVYLIVLIPIGICFYIRFPKKLIVDSTSLPSSESAQDLTHTNDSQPNKIITLLLNKRYLLLAVSFGGCGMAMAFIDVHLVALIKTIDTLQVFNSNDTFVATSLSLLGITELIGSGLVLIAVKRYNLYVVLGSLYLIRAITFWLMGLFSIDSVYVLLLSLFGLTYMGTVIISSLLCLRWYGAHIKGTMFGMLFFVHQVFVFASVWLGGLNFDVSGSYKWYLYALIVMCLISAMASFKLRSINHNELIDPN
ncbi:MFS transporter [Psychrobacter lutiphocae]|uniref:MFS transporter n=1 Tax=Psychrobacter lutiphocae TaxID=540500 RepID=UPI00036EAB79|nr:MFS transporter [Psychrobacter lutiphocae]